MSSLLPQSLIPDYQRPLGRPYSRAAAMISWLVIIASLATVALANWHASRTEARMQAVENIKLSMTSRFVVGEFHELSKHYPNVPGINYQMGRQIDSLAKEPRAQLLVASVIGEIQGGKAALDELDRLAPSIHDPQGRADLATLRIIYSSKATAISQQQREQLIRNEGWFGNLALSFGLPDSNPFRADILHKAQTTFIGTAIFEFAIGLAVFVGLVLLIFAIVFLALGRIHLCYRPASVRTTAFLESFALYLGGYVCISLLARWFMPNLPFAGILFLLCWLPFAIAWPLMRGVNWSGLKGGLGWYTGQGLFREMGAGIVGYTAGLPIVVVAALATMMLTRISGTNPSHPFVLADTKQIWQVLELYVLGCVFAPLVEESLFRGTLFNHLRQWHGWLLSAVVSSFIFAALHPQGWVMIPVLGSIGFILAGIREWRGTFIASATAHSLNNAVVITLLVITLR
jgi:membrane protease YdiL (CAAX protease family)